ncbi:MAG: hypothetical protein ACI86X_002264 [Moritella sp.]|jgi:hypothetical protein
MAVYQILACQRAFVGGSTLMSAGEIESNMLMRILQLLLIGIYMVVVTFLFFGVFQFLNPM